jgi:hypothetical protein
MMPRPTKYSPDIVKRILDALAAGNTRRASVQHAGVSEDAFGRWLRRYADFADAVFRAEAQAEVAHVANIAQAARAGDVRASIFWLERRRGQDWGRRDYLEIQIRAAAERVAAATGADASWLIARAEEIAAQAAAERSEG